MFLTHFISVFLNNLNDKVNHFWNDTGRERISWWESEFFLFFLIFIIKERVFGDFDYMVRNILDLRCLYTVHWLVTVVYTKILKMIMRFTVKLVSQKKKKKKQFKNKILWWEDGTSIQKKKHRMMSSIIKIFFDSWCDCLTKLP